MHSERIRIWIGFVIVSFVWGSTWLAIKVGLQSVPPFLAAGLRFMLASMILYAIVRVKKLPIALNRDLFILYGSLALLSYSVPFALVYWGQQFIPTGLSSILFGVFPFWVALFSHYLLPAERLTILKVIGIVLGFSGVTVIFARDVDWLDPNGMAGMGAIILTTVLQAFSVVLVKKYGQPVSPFVMNFVGMSAGGVILLGLSLGAESQTGIRWDAAAVGSILYLAVIGSVLAFVTYHWLLKRIEAVYLSLVSFINPIVAVILGAVVLGEKLPPGVFVGAALVLIGVLVANARQIYVRLAGSLT